MGKTNFTMVVPTVPFSRAGGWSGGREARKDYGTRPFGCNRECVHFKLEVGEGCVWPSPPSRLQWLASSPPTSLVDRRPARGCGRTIGCVPSIYRSGGGYGQNQLYYGCAHRPILQSAIGGPPTRVGGREDVGQPRVAMGNIGALGVGQRGGDVGRHVGPRQ